MSCYRSLCKDDLARVLTPKRGIAAFGIAAARPVDAEASARYSRWIAAGCHGSMEYLARNCVVRDDPRLLLDDGVARSLVVCAFPYYPHEGRSPELPHIARYALGRDYHEVVRERLSEAVGELRDLYGGEWRVCVDTAPLRERYWAVQAGVGFVGRNSQLIVPGVGSYCFIGTIITSVEIEPDKPCTCTCDGCGRCVAECPGGAIGPDGSFDARRCLSYLTIEYRGAFPEGTRLGNALYGCDRCQEVCPHNCRPMPALLPDFDPRPGLLQLTADDVAGMTPEGFSKLFSHSAVKRTKLAGLLRNLAALGK